MMKRLRSDELWKWSAAELARGIRTRAISAREAVESCLDRMEQINPKINALAEITAEAALRAADEADRAAKAMEELGPLHGVPTATKINVDQQGLATTDGVAAFRDNIARSDSPPVANLRKAGAILVGRTNVPAFSLRWFSSNDLHGRTLNPWDLTRTPGGSSGGAGAAVASGMVPVAHGNDIAGSIRYPAYACGVMGIRPTVGRVPGRSGPEDSDIPLGPLFMAVEGPLARCVADLRLALKALSAHDPRDPLHTEVPLEGAPLKRPVRVALVRDVGVARPIPQVNRALDIAAGCLGNAGYIVEEVDLPLLAEAFRLWTLLVLEDLREMMPVIEQFGDEAVKTNLRYNYEIQKETWGDATYDQYRHGYARRGTLIATLQKFMQDYPILLLPVSCELPFRHDEDIASLDSNFRLWNAQWPMISIPLLGFPALSIPVCVQDGLPVGVQLVGRRFREDTLFDAAETIEAQTGCFTPIDPQF